MTFSTLWRPLALAGLVSAALAAPAAAQTVVVRGLPPGGAAELVQGIVTATGMADAGGDAVLTGSLTDPGDIRINIFVDACDAVRRVVITERGVPPPPAPDGCTRAPVPGVFVIGPVSTIVVAQTGTNPTVLLRQGPFDFRRVYSTAVEPPAGLVISGGGGYGRLHNANRVACGDIGECPGNDAGLAYGGAIGYWFTPYAGIEASYLKPKSALTEGAILVSLFRTTLDADMLTFVAKIGVPAGRVRFYGQGGATYHRATMRTIQDFLLNDPERAIEDRFELRTAGWGWVGGGGLEIWVAPAVALYGEGGYAALKGGGVETGGEGRLNERLSFATFGLRFNIRRR